MTNIMSNTTNPQEKELEILLEIGESFGKKSGADYPQPDIASLINSSIFKPYALNEKDIQIIAFLLKNVLERDEEITAKKVLMKIDKETKSAFIEVKRVIRLKELKIIDIEEDVRNPFEEEEGKEVSGSTMNALDIFRSAITLSNEFLEKLFGSRKTPKEETIAPYKDNLEYLCDQFERIDLLSDRDENPFRPIRRIRLRRKMFPAFSREPRKSGEGQLKEIGERIEQRLQKSGRTFPFEEFKKKKNLTLKEEMIILALLKMELSSGESYEKSFLLNLISQTRYERLTNKTLFEKEGRLVREKMIKIEKNHSFFGNTSDEMIRLNPSLTAELSGEKKMGQRTKLLKDETFFEVITPTIPLEKIILHPVTFEDIDLTVEMIQGETSRLLSEWGIKGTDLIQQTAIGKKRQPVTLLFYGDPGTGKTLTANAMAHALKRKLLTLDCSKILSKWVGDSEQNVRKIFDRYREISKEMKTPPVLLLNEADQFFHTRVNAKGSVDHMYNQMQNIFLEQLEKFEGVLIATTNLKENIDAAFSRRFHHKIEFKRPKQPEILKLWKIHLPPNAPLAEDVDLEYLSKIYDLSGGQIAVAVRNAATRGARRRDQICQEDLIKACEEEISGNFDEKSRGRIGFGGKGI